MIKGLIEYLNIIDTAPIDNNLKAKLRKDIKLKLKKQQEMKPKNSDEFNEKWGEYIEMGHYGLAFDNLEIIEYLDKEFTKEAKKNPNFCFTQIKLKFGRPTIYATSSEETINKWIKKLNRLINKNEIN